MRLEQAAADCAAQFEEFCTVGQSVRQQIPLAVEVYDSEGLRLK